MKTKTNSTLEVRTERGHTPQKKKLSYAVLAIPTIRAERVSFSFAEVIETALWERVGENESADDGLPKPGLHVAALLKWQGSPVSHC